MWYDLQWLGSNAGSFFPTITSVIRWGLGPLGFSNFFIPISILFLGLSAGFLFRQLKLSPMACALGGLAAALNSDFFSESAWGLASHGLTFGLEYLALAALVDTSSKRRWLKVILAGLAVGMGIMEGADIGAIFSLFVAAFVMFQAWVGEGVPAARLSRGIIRTIVVALFAAFISAQALTALIGTQIQGIAGAQQNEKTKAEQWNWATQWSLPKVETLGVVVPGLFGYRMSTPDGGSYWGTIGRDADWDNYFSSGKQGPPPSGFIRYTGSGFYAGVVVMLIVVWTVLQAFRKNGSVFSETNRRLIWFFSGTAIISLLFAFGRHAPFYRLVYMLPYFSTIRNPTKFMHVFSWAVVVLFALGVHGLSRVYLESAKDRSSSLKNWWATVGGFDRKWVISCVAVIAFSLLGWLVYASSRQSLEAYLQTVQFDEGTAKDIAGFSIRQVGWFIGFLAAGIGMMTLIISGLLSGSRAKWAGILLGILVVSDLGRANLPWITYWNYKQKYEINPTDPTGSTNPIINLLRNKPYEHRVVELPFNPPPALSRLHYLYRIEWAQHQFPYYNIQSLDIVQMSRTPEDMEAFERALMPNGTEAQAFLIPRKWELTNTRYLLGPAGFLEPLNEQIDPIKKRFRIVERFNIVLKPGLADTARQGYSADELTADLSPNGEYALFDFTGALPRVKLYTHWEASVSDTNALRELASKDFNPAQIVIVANDIQKPSVVSDSTSTNTETVEFTNYTPTDIKLHASAAAPSVLLLNDRFDPHWQVWVDGKQEQLLRCNYIMRGVLLSPGEHQVEFVFRLPHWSLYVSLSAIGLGLLLLVTVGVWKDAATVAPDSPPTVRKPPAKPSRNRPN